MSAISPWKHPSHAICLFLWLGSELPPVLAPGQVSHCHPWHLACLVPVRKWVSKNKIMLLLYSRNVFIHTCILQMCIEEPCMSVGKERLVTTQARGKEAAKVYEQIITVIRECVIIEVEYRSMNTECLVWRNGVRYPGGNTWCGHSERCTRTRTAESGPWNLHSPLLGLPVFRRLVSWAQRGLEAWWSTGGLVHSYFEERENGNELWRCWAKEKDSAQAGGIYLGERFRGWACSWAAFADLLVLVCHWDENQLSQKPSEGCSQHWISEDVAYFTYKPHCN